MIAQLLILIFLRSTAGFVYFHELSKVILKPNVVQDQSEFGLSMGYQGGKSRKLIVGAPHSGLVGKVFQCDVQNALTNKTNVCDDIPIDVDKLAPYSREPASDLKLNLGASIAATPDYFLTCAPLWTTSNYSYGTCFIYDGEVHRYQGLIESGDPKKSYQYNIRGGIGWNTLVDEKKDNLIIAKVLSPGNFFRLNASNPLAPVESYEEKPNPFARLGDMGYAMTAGQFFNPNGRLYAISAATMSSSGVIYFLRDEAPSSKIKGKVKRLQIIRHNNYNVNITDTSIGAMFGAALHAADLNKDGLSELLVGAVAQDDNEGGFEMGALHIYLGGKLISLNDENRHRVILGTQNGARLSTAIATSDVDGDGFPEIFVSAPYDGTGSLFILSGFEIEIKLLRHNEFKQISLSELKLSQMIQSMESRTFGRSLKVLPDLDENGCDELAVGSPGSNEVVMLRCLPAINVTVTTELIGEGTVKEQANNFIVGVCINTMPLKKKNFTAEFTIINEIMGNQASIEEEQRIFSVEVSEAKRRLCRSITVVLNDHEPGEYRFTTTVKMNQETMLTVPEFNRSWVSLSPHSVMEAGLEVSRHCTGTDCDPALSLKITWDEATITNETYVIGSSDSLTVNVTVTNNGSSSFDACAKIRVKGAPVALIGCSKNADGYTCYMRKPLKRFEEQITTIKLNTSRLTNFDMYLNVNVELFQFCDRPSDKDTNIDEAWILLSLNTSDVVVKGTVYNQTVSDTEIEDARTNYVRDVQEYLVINDGTVTWKFITALVSIKKQPFIETSRISFHSPCKRFETNEEVKFNCTYTLMPHTISKFIVINDVPKYSVVNSLVNGKLNIETNFYLILTPTTEVKSLSLTSAIEFQSELSLGHNKGLVIFLAILGAVIILAVVVFILHKMEFFKRKEKTRLEALKQDHIRRTSVKHSTSGPPNPASDDFVEMEVDDDSPFEIVDMSEPVLKQDNTKE